MSSRSLATIPSLSRRRFLAAGSAVALLPVAARAQSDATPGADGEWTFVDDFGNTITRPERPQSVVAYLVLAASLWDFGIRPTAFFGIPRRPDGSPEIYVGNIDLDAVASIGETYGEIDLEQLVALKPDIIVNDKWTDELDVWGLPADSLAQLQTVAPIVNIDFVARPVTDTIGRVEELAIALGADVNAPDVAAARQRFDQASADLKAAVAEKPGLKAMFVSGDVDNFYVGNPKQNSDLYFFRELGLDIVQPDVEEDFFEALSWEQAGKYPADLFLNDARAGSYTVEQLMAVPTFASLPAAQAGQIGRWDSEYVPSYGPVAEILERLTETVRSSQPDLV